MKQYILIVFSLVTFNLVQAQEIPQSQVPSMILNNFSIQFPKAHDVEWEMKGDHYLVDFELDNDKDHKIWYDVAGKLVKSKEEITKDELPAAVSSAIYAQFKGYEIEDVDKITTKGKVSYEVELDAPKKKEWEVTFDHQGTILTQKAD